MVKEASGTSVQRPAKLCRKLERANRIKSMQSRNEWIRDDVNVETKLSERGLKTALLISFAQACCNVL